MANRTTNECGFLKPVQTGAPAPNIIKKASATRDGRSCEWQWQNIIFGFKMTKNKV
jgi:hypothetical protein